MRPVYLGPKDVSPEGATRRWLVCGAIVLSLLLASAAACAQEFNGNPMEDNYSQDVRKDYAKCREIKNPMSQFFCSCRVLDKQCEAPRKLEHGDWSTVEFWPSDEPKEREVQFVLLTNHDELGDFDTLDKGIVMTCLAGVSEFNIFLGDRIDPDSDVSVWVGKESFATKVIEDTGDYMLHFKQADALFGQMKKEDVLTVEFETDEGELSQMEFDVIGFDYVTKGWDPLCTSPES